MAEQNIWDRAGRYAIRFDPHAFFEWTLNLPRMEAYFDSWEDTRNVPFPTDPDRTTDTVARIHNLQENGQPWAVIVEVQSEPDPRMLGRVNAFGGSLWLEKKPDEEKGSRYLIAALVINLSGSSPETSSQNWQQTGLQSLAGPKILNVASESAEETLNRIENGQLGLGVLPWIPLMQGGGEMSIIQRWKELGKSEQNRFKRSDYGALARIFAEKGGCKEIWKDELKEWNMVESEVLKEWTIEAEMRGIVDTLSLALASRFGDEGSEFAEELRKIQSLDELHNIQQAAFQVNKLDELRAMLNGSHK